METNLQTASVTPLPPATCSLIGLQEVVCGDCNVVGPQTGANVLVFDPPWEIEWEIPRGEWRHKIVFSDPQRLKDVLHMFGVPTTQFVWDCVSSWWVPGRPLKRAKIALWYGPMGDWNPDRAMLDKPQPARLVKNTRGGYKSEAKPGTQLSEVYTLPITQRRADPHEKPMEWVRAMIGGCCGNEPVVYDPYAGSGSVAVACAELGIPSRSIEIDDAKFCAICDRLRDRTKPPEIGELFSANV